MYYLQEMLLSPIGLIIVCFWVLMLMDCINRREQQWLWILILFFPVGALIYYIAVRPPIIPPGLMSIITGKPTTESQIREISAKIRRAPDAILYLELGRLYMEARKIEAAAQALEKSLELDRENPATHLFMGKALFEQKKYQDALSHLEIAVTTKERHHLIESRRLMALSHEKLGNEKKAMESYEKVIAVYPFSEARYSYGLLLEKYGRKNEACSQMEAIIAEAEDLPSFSARKERVWVGKARKFLARCR